MPESFQGKSPFKDYIVPAPQEKGDFAKTRGGVDIADGKKETAGSEISQTVTFADVQGGPTPGESAEPAASGGGKE